jgi:peptide/nickel transport system permease protein
MTNYVIRRVFQMAIVIFVAAIFVYFLFNISPGGPLAGIQQQQQRLTRQDLARLRAQYELDLYWPWRFTRWMVGVPNGPITIGGRELFKDTPVGCYLPVYDSSSDSALQPTVVACDDYVYLSELPQLHPPARSSRGILRGDFGPSTVILRGRPVADLLESRIGPTVQLMSISLFLSLLLGVPIGIYSAVKQYSKFDYFFTTISFVGSAMPTFFFALLLILLFSVFPVFLVDTVPWIPRLPPGLREAVRPYSVASWLPRVQPGSGMDHFLHLLMPVSVLTFFNMAPWSRFVRSSMLEVMRQDYVRTARAKGLVERTVILKHALRNALIPFVTIVVLSLPQLFAGAIITETVFAWPGMGRLYFDALSRSDWNVALAFIFITALLTVIATLIGDLLYTVVDPRIKFS